MPLYPHHPYPGGVDELARLRVNLDDAMKQWAADQHDIRAARDLLRTGRPEDARKAQAILSRLLEET